MAPFTMPTMPTMMATMPTMPTMPTLPTLPPMFNPFLPPPQSPFLSFMAPQAAQTPVQTPNMFPFGLQSPPSPMSPYGLSAPGFGQTYGVSGAQPPAPQPMNIFGVPQVKILTYKNRASQIYTNRPCTLRLRNADLDKFKHPLNLNRDLLEACS